MNIVFNTIKHKNATNKKPTLGWEPVKEPPSPNPPKSQAQL